MYRKQITLVRRHGWRLLLLAAIPCAWFWPLLAGQLPDFMDTVTQIWPYRVATARQIREGVLPLWLPSIFCGMPLAANPQIAVWYPPQVFFYLWPTATCYGVLCIAHYVIGGWGAYLLAHRLTRNRLAALFGAVAMQLGPMLVSHIALTPHLYTTVWVPWILWAVERRGSTRRFQLATVLLLGALVALQILAGAPQVTYYTLLLLPVYWFVRWILRSGLRQIWVPALEFALAVLLAALIASIQLVPTLAFLVETRRGAIDPARLHEQALNGSFIWRALVGFTLDGFEDTDTINAIGLGALALAAFALAGRRSRRKALPFFGIGTVALLLAIGTLVPIWSSLLPMFSSFHAPRRALVVWSVTGPIAGAVGFARMHALLRRRKASPWVLSVAGALAICGTFWILPRLEREFTSPARLEAPPKVAAAIGSARYITVDPTLNYSYGSRRENYGKSMLPDLACLNGMHDAQGYDPLVLRRFALARDVACARSGVFFPSHGVFFTNPGSHLLRLMNVQYLVGRWDLFDPGSVIQGAGFDRKALATSLERVIDDREWPVFRFKDERPLAWIPKLVARAPSPEAAVGSVSVQDPLGTAFVEDMEVLGAAPTTCTVRGRMIDARTCEVEFETPPARACNVCIALPYCEGWRARSPADGRELVVRPANGFLCSVTAAADTKTFRLQYDPASFHNGRYLSTAGILVLLLGMLLLAVRSRRRHRAQPALPLPVD